MKEIKVMLAKNAQGEEGIVVGEVELEGEKMIMPIMASDDGDWVQMKQYGLEVCEKDGVEPIEATFMRVIGRGEV